jgi:hypothetical protein
MILGTVREAVVDFVKTLIYGTKDVRNATAILPQGVDSKPLKGRKAAYSDTSNSEVGLILGYTYTSEITKAGELRFFAQNSEGSEVFSMYFKNDGTVEFGGKGDNLVKFLPLDSGLQAQNTAINAEFVKIQAAITALAGSYTRQQVNVDIDNSKIDNIKV